MEATSGILFVRKILQKGKQDSDADRLIQIASELTIHSEWLLNNRLRMSANLDRVDATTVIQRFYRKYYRKKKNLQKLKALKEARRSPRNDSALDISPDEAKGEDPHNSGRSNSNTEQVNINEEPAVSTNKDYCTIS